MIWFMIAYVLGLFYFTANPEKIVHRRRFRLAWIVFAGVPLTSAFFTLLRAATIGSARSLAIVEIFSRSISWLLIGVSFLILLGALLPQDKRSGDADS